MLRKNNNAEGFSEGEWTRPAGFAHVKTMAALNN